ncbi:MAG: hypothetical protein IT385_24810 [Deltaproteobacteria bacterium]|nr:hypothetical protein [Deltaproteobacteria bacterium]
MGRPVKHDDARTLAFCVLMDADRPPATGPSGSGELLSAALSASGLDGRDRGLATELVYGVLRWRMVLDAALAPFVTRGLDGVEPSARALLRLGAYQIAFLDRIPREVAVSATQDAAKRLGLGRLTGLLNAVLRKVAAAPRPTADAMTSLPGWIVGHLREAFGDAAATEAAALRERATTTLRPSARVLREVVRDGLVAAGLEVSDAPRGFFAVAGGDPAHTAPWRDGLVVAQDPAGAVVTDRITRGQRVLDLCAGRGIKTTAIADLGADVVAVDVSPGKLEALGALARRLGVSDRIVATHVRDATAPLDDLGLFDEVLVDAPCSGLGTLRRHPEIAWRRTPADVASLVELQRRLVLNALARVRPGGRLTYAVCSFVRVEGRAALDCPGFEVEERIDIAPSSGMDAFQIVRIRNQAALADDIRRRTA